MEKRASKRIDLSLVVKFISGTATCYGIATNASENGLCIKTGQCLKNGTDAALRIPVKDDDIEIPIKVRWARDTNGFYDKMGVEVLEPSKEYLSLLSSLKKVYS